VKEGSKEGKKYPCVGQNNGIRMAGMGDKGRKE
jgi:hypothetical protein